MVVFKISIICIIFLIILCFVYIFLTKNTKKCENKKLLDNVFSNKSSPYKFSKLSKSYCYQSIFFTFSQINEPLFFQKRLLKNKNYLLTLAKTIDFKINSNKNTYRAKNNYILIEQVANVCANQIFSNNPCSVFFTYKNLVSKYNIRLKENRVFKFLLAKSFFEKLFLIENESAQIERVIFKSKKILHLKKFKKQILNSAQIYSIKKFNPSSTKLLIKNKNVDFTIKNFLYELEIIDSNEKMIIAYLTTIFS